MADGYAPEMRRLAERYVPRGIAFYGVHCDPGVSAEAAARHAAGFGLSFPVLLDPKQVVAGEAGVGERPRPCFWPPTDRCSTAGRSTTASSLVIQAGTVRGRATSKRH